MSDVFNELSTDITRELTEAESALRQAEADVAAAVEARAVTQLVIAELSAAFDKLDPDGHTAERIRQRLRDQQRAHDTVTISPNAALENAKIRVDRLHAELA